MGPTSANVGTQQAALKTTWRYPTLPMPESQSLWHLSDTEPRMVLSDEGGRVTEFNSTVVTVSVFFVIQC